MSVVGDVDRTPSERADVCVIGAGPAGALCALGLAEAGHDVVVLEAGPEFDLDRRSEQLERAVRPGHAPTDVWEMGGERDAYVSTGGPHYPLNQKRVKGVGGSTLHWGGKVWRLHEADFELETRHGIASDWPIAYEDLRPWYAAAERAIGIAGDADNPFGPPREEDYPLPAFPPSYADRLLAEAADAVDVATHSVPRAQASEPYDGRSACVGYGHCGTCPSGAKYTADVHVRRAIEAGARVVDRVPVQRLEHDDAGDVLEAAVYATPDGDTHRQEARQFVLAAGGVEVPRLLLLSRSEAHPDGLANASGLVGRYFAVHPGVTVVGRVDEPTGQHQLGFSTRASHQFYGHDGDVPGSLMLTFRNRAGPNPLRTALAGGDTDRRDDLRDPVAGDEWGAELLETVRETSEGYLAIYVEAEQLPDPSNRIALADSRTDDRGNPAPDVSLSIDARVRAALEAGADVATDVLEAAGAEIVSAGNVGDPVLPAHHVGTTRMGTDPEESVVTPHLRTHDLENCWIPSSSAFVTGGAVNPTLTIAALALRLADRLDEEL